MGAGDGDGEARFVRAWSSARMVGDDGEQYCAIGPWRSTEEEAHQDAELANEGCDR